MAQVYLCTFNNVNGENTAVFTRTGMGKHYPSAGILYRKNCPDNWTFYADPNVGGTNNYYKLIDPELYGINSSGTVYVWLDKGHLSSWKLVDDPKATNQPVETVQPPVEAPKPEVPTSSSVSQQINDNKTTNGLSELSLSRNSNSALITNAKSELLSDNISNYIIADNSSVIRNNYYNDYSLFINDINVIENNMNIGINARNAAQIKSDMINKFNRFKIAFPNDVLTKSFAYVFFTRPDLNIYESTGINLVDKVSNDPFFYYMSQNSPDLLRSLTSRFSGKHDFNPYLSNKAGSFELKDEFIETGEYGETFTGWKIKYGKHNIKSKTAGDFDITYTDDNNYNIFKIHKAWTDYISKVYRGAFDASRESIRTHTLDYASSVYYFLCGPDGETILFWTKYTGVFPTNTPSSYSAWRKGDLLKMPEVSIHYEFSWKEDMNPATLAEFNLNSAGDKSYNYANIYEPELASTGKTFVNAPFIQTVITNGKYDFKLRFRP